MFSRLHGKPGAAAAKPEELFRRQVWTVLPPEAALQAFEVNGFLVRATGTFEGPAIASRVTGLDPRKVHSRGAFWAPRAIVYVRACRRVFELRHVRLRTGYMAGVATGPSATGAWPRVAANSLQFPPQGSGPDRYPIPNALAVGAGLAPAPTALSPAMITNPSSLPRLFASESTAARNAAPSRARAG